MLTTLHSKRIFSLVNYDEFIEYVKEVFGDNPYAFEICATDMWCLKDNTEYENIFITRSQNDKGIDAIVVPQENMHYHGRNFFLIQVTMGSKSDASLTSFLKDPTIYYPKLIPNGGHCKRVVLALGTATCSDTSVEIINGQNLAKLIIEVGTRFNIIKGGQFTDEYLLNVMNRADRWENIHNSKEQVCLMPELSRFFKLNHTLLRNGHFNLPQDLSKLIRYHEERIIGITTTSNRERFMVYFTLKAESRGLVLDKAKQMLALLVGEQLNYDENFVIAPTKRYLTIKLPNSNAALAHLDWAYDSPYARQCIFGFKCNYDEVSHLDPRLKPIEAVKNHLHFKMKTALVKPTLDDGKLIRDLVIKSQEVLLAVHV